MWVLRVVLVVALAAGGCGGSSEERVDGGRATVPSDGPVGARTIDERDGATIVASGPNALVLGGYVADETVFQEADGRSIQIRTGAESVLERLPFGDRPINIDAVALGDDRILAVGTVCPGASVGADVFRCARLRVAAAVYGVQSGAWTELRGPEVTAGPQAPDGVLPRVDLLPGIGASTAVVLEFVDPDRGTVSLFRFEDDSDTWTAVPVPPALGQMCVHPDLGMFLLIAEHHFDEAGVAGRDPAPTLELWKLRGHRWAREPAALGEHTGSVGPLLVCDSSGPVLVGTADGTALYVDRPLIKQRDSVKVEVLASPHEVLATPAGVVVATASGQLVLSPVGGTPTVLPDRVEGALAMSYSTRGGFLAVLDRAPTPPEGEQGGDETLRIIPVGVGS